MRMSKYIEDDWNGEYINEDKPVYLVNGEIVGKDNLWEETVTYYYDDDGNEFKKDEVKEYEVDLDITQSDIKGDYTITLGEDNKTVPVTYSNGKLNYRSEVTPLYDEEILNLVVQREFFTSLDVKETFKSAETELREIVYQPENNSDLYKHLKSKYDLPEETTCIVLVNHSSSTIYRVTIQLKSNQKIVQISSVIFEKE